MKQTFSVPEHANGERLDVFLTNQLPEMTRSQIAKFLKRGGATVNGEVASVHRFLKTDEKIEFTTDVQPSKNKASEERRTAPKHHVVPNVPIIAETPDWLIIDKPAGLLVHPTSEKFESNEPTLVDFLVAHDKNIAKVGEDPSRPGIMHRLDREASGLMVIAKTQDAFDSLKSQFAEHSVDKRYIALVYGEMEKEEGDIKFRIARSQTQSRMAARPEHEKVGRAAWTHFHVEKSFHNAALLELTIFSGRTHQIRAHLFALNHPIIGDPLYKQKSQDRNVKAPRLMLQSVHLQFKDPATGEEKVFTLPPAAEFATIGKLLSHA